ncbi:MAG: M16 family metallopeptidase [Mycoplasmatales bacterium]
MNYKHKVDASKMSSISHVKVIEFDHKYQDLHIELYSRMLTKQIDGLNKKSLQSKLYSLYDVTYNVSKSIYKGNIILTYKIEYIQDKYLPQKISNKVINLFTKALKSKQFTQKHLDEEIKIYLKSLKRLEDNKAIYNKALLSEHIYTDSRLSSIEEVSKYLETLKIDQLEQEYKLISKASSYNLMINEDNFKYRTSHKEIVFNPLKLSKKKELEFNDNLDQAYVSFAYRIRNFDLQKLSVANSILGSGVHSKLFKIIREKHSLSYTINSTVEPNVFMINGGVNKKSTKRVIKYVDAIINDLKAGHFKREFILAKQKLKEDIYKSQNNFGYINSLYLEQYLEAKEVSVDTKLASLSDITLDEILEVYKGMKYLSSSIYK